MRQPLTHGLKMGRAWVPLSLSRSYLPNVHLLEVAHLSIAPPSFYHGLLGGYSTQKLEQ